MTIATKKTNVNIVPGAEWRTQTSSLGLHNIGDLSALLDTPTSIASSGGPILINMNLIDEDSYQPRTANNPGFLDESLDELAASIKLRGVKTPISVRDNPEIPGRFIINHGARRYRASKRAGMATIPGFIDNDYNEADQVVENLQRNELTAREIADYIGRELAKGIKKGEIAKIISKSPAFISQHVTLLDLPDPLAKVFNSGRTNDVTIINELMTAFKRKPQEVGDWLNDENQEITRGSVKMLREFLDEKKMHEQQNESDEEVADNGDSFVTKKKEERVVDPENLKKAIIQVQYKGLPARLLLNRRPPDTGFAWLKYDDNGQEVKVRLAQVQLVAIIEG